VPYGAPGDEVTLGPLQTKKSFARGWIQTLHTPSSDRTDPRCPLFFKPGAAVDAVCGGCDWQHLRYAAQKKAKRQLLIETFQRIGRIPKPIVEETLRPEGETGPWRYRNKVQIPFALGPDGRVTAGFYAPASHTVVPLEDCVVQNETSLAIFRAVREWFRVRPVPVYDTKTKSGWLRHLLIRTNQSGQALAALVTGQGPVPNLPEFIAHLTAACPAVISLYQNINTREDNVVLGPQWRQLHGRSYLPEKLLGLKFKLSPGAFFQVHHAMAEKLYATAVRWADPGPEDAVLELYAGIGAMGLLLARKAKFVWGIEESPLAVADAVASSNMNGIENVRFLTGKCETVLARSHFRDQFKNLAAVILDPPRAGCESSVLKAVMKLRPRRIVYVSCDPATLARDARFLSTGGYHLSRCVPVDLFPQTSHIESVSLFEPKNPSAPAS